MDLRQSLERDEPDVASANVPISETREEVIRVQDVGAPENAGYRARRWIVKRIADMLCRWRGHDWVIESFGKRWCQRCHKRGWLVMRPRSQAGSRWTL